MITGYLFEDFVKEVKAYKEEREGAKWFVARLRRCVFLSLCASLWYKKREKKKQVMSAEIAVSSPVPPELSTKYLILLHIP